jgi:hypothetical protein
MRYYNGGLKVAKRKVDKSVDELRDLLKSKTSRGKAWNVPELAKLLNANVVYPSDLAKVRLTEVKSASPEHIPRLMVWNATNISNSILVKAGVKGLCKPIYSESGFAEVEALLTEKGYKVEKPKTFPALVVIRI